MCSYPNGSEPSKSRFALGRQYPLDDIPVIRVLGSRKAQALVPGGAVLPCPLQKRKMTGEGC